MPSEPTEGLPTVILEAMTCGTPAYATPVSGVPDVVRERRTGFLMSSRDPDGIAADIEAILDREDLETSDGDVRRRVNYGGNSFFPSTNKRFLLQRVQGLATESIRSKIAQPVSLIVLIGVVEVRYTCETIRY
jgi:glycosyltransferase involved in cell wall biosynthesis